jgi:hypothetical protein
VFNKMKQDYLVGDDSDDSESKKFDVRDDFIKQRRFEKFQE